MLNLLNKSNAFFVSAAVIVTLIFAYFNSTDYYLFLHLASSDLYYFLALGSRRIGKEEITERSDIRER